MPASPTSFDSSLSSSANSSRDYCALRTTLKAPRTWQDPPLPIRISDLPSLPSVKNGKLKERAITHRSSYTQSTHVSDRISVHRDVQFKSYESLELVGDKHMASCAVQALTKRFPELPPVRMTDLLSMVLSNRTISYLTLAYELDRKLRVARLPRNGERLDQKVSADLFEAHIGALLLDDDVSDTRIKEWLSNVFSSRIFPTLEELVNGWTKEHERELIVSRGCRRKASSQGKH
ncbi:hypothetical protein JCM5350_008334 [Sporobolomyces pararoseus]